MPAGVASPLAAMRPMDAHQADQLGARIRAELDGWAPPFLAIQTSHSVLRGTAVPGIWGHALRSLHGPAAGPWGALADQDDLLALPLAIEKWGRERVAVAATIELPGMDGDWDGSGPSSGERTPRTALLLAPTERAYATLCTLLSHRHEAPEDFSAWLRGSGGLDMDDMVVLIDDAAWAIHLTRRGVEVWWRSDLRPRSPAPEVLAAGIRVASVPLLRHLDGVGQGVEGVLTAIREGTTVTSRSPIPLGSLADLPAMRKAYAGYEEWIAAGWELRARCRYVPGLDAMGTPVIHMPPSPHAQAEDANAELARLAEDGLRERYGATPDRAASDRLAHELAVIRQKRFAGYILTVHDIAKGRRTCGRGSGASSLVVYCLGITNVDPIRYNLLFERFLAPERSDPPDIDVDFPWDERDTVIAMALERYGRDRAALVATHQTLKFAGAVREAARAHGLDDGSISVMRQAFVEHERYGKALDLPEPWPSILQTASLIAGGPRHLGVHCGGVVITEQPIRSLVPVHSAAKTIDGIHCPCIAWEKDGTENLGLVKIDLLSNRSLAVIRDCLADLAEDGVHIDERRWRPADDPATRRIVALGLTQGCFYIESPAMRQLQAKVGSGAFDRLVVHSSIIRPAANRWITEYVKRHHYVLKTGEHLDSWYPHPALRGLLSESYGVLSYQEDVMLTCQRLAGFQSKEANVIRKALGKWDAPERLRVLAPAFFAGCATQGVTAQVANTVWDMISSFAGYSFCKAHSASFAMVSFECAWLKAHYPAYFMARVIANEGGFYSTSAYIEEARRLGVAIHGPCVQRSGWKACREGAGALRLGLQHIPGLERGEADRVIARRSERAFVSLTDLVRRAGIPADCVVRLREAGVLDGLMPRHSPEQLAWLTEVVCRWQDGHRPTRGGGQQVIDLVTVESDADPSPPALPRGERLDHLRRKLNVLGFLPEAHPLTLWSLPGRRTMARDLSPAMVGRLVTLVGFNLTRKQVSAQVKTDEDGKELAEPVEQAMAFVTLEDETGLIETVWFPEAYRKFGVCLERSGPVRFRGRVACEFGVVSIEVEEAGVVMGTRTGS